MYGQVSPCTCFARAFVICMRVYMFAHNCVYFVDGCICERVCVSVCASAFERACFCFRVWRMLECLSLCV